ncbi:MAG: adenosine kinase [Bacteroidales bacterium]|nr:adenosine kinase [Bacteroidales bacterium]MCB8998715.1 adenosine kinase [Bacteroidales bacterium]
MKILGMGNALVDIMTQLKDESILERFKLPKGSMTLVDNEMSSYVHNETMGLLKQKTSGGSAANTIHGLAHLGADTSFIGKIGNDELGRFFKKDMKINGINPILYKSITDTGRAVALVTPDSERTFATYLGAAVELDAQDLTSDIFTYYHYFYIEGYLVQNRELIEKALRLAKHAGLKTCIDLASYNIVQENVDFLKELINNYVDIVFANEEEAKALTGKLPEEAIKELSGICETAIVKIGALGSLIMKGNELTRVSARKAKSVDTTGAGDLYAAGFLYGHSKGYSHKVSGEIGSILAARVIEDIGAKMSESTWEMLRRDIKSVEEKQ